VEPKQAVAKAREHLSSVYAGEPDFAVPTLEEIWREENGSVWCVTLGLHRPNRTTSIMGTVVRIGDYKVIRLRDGDGSLISIKNREGERAA